MVSLVIEKVLLIKATLVLVLMAITVFSVPFIIAHLVYYDLTSYKPTALKPILCGEQTYYIEVNGTPVSGINIALMCFNINYYGVIGEDRFNFTPVYLECNGVCTAYPNPIVYVKKYTNRTTITIHLLDVNNPPLNKPQKFNERTLSLYTSSPSRISLNGTQLVEAGGKIDIVIVKTKY